MSRTIDLHVLPLLLYLVLLVALSPIIVLHALYLRFIARPRTAPHIFRSMYTPLPPCLLTPPLPVPYAHCFVHTPTSRVHYISTARPAAASEVVLLFVHGFPECWYGWRKQLAHFAPHHRCLAVDMRGFGYSEVAGDKDDPRLYTWVEQCRDLVAVLDAEGVQRVLLVGHDWGGVVVWQFARRYPHRLHGVASLCTMYRPTGALPPLSVILRVAPHWLYQLYFAFFRQQAAVAFESDPERALALLFRSSEPSDALSSLRLWTALLALTGFHVRVPRSTMLSAEELSHMVDMARWSGFAYGLMWYSTLRINARQLMRSEAELGLAPLGSSPQPGAPRGERISVPALMMPAECDVILQPALADGMQRWCDELTRVDIRRASHWAALEQPDQVNAALEAFIERIHTQLAKDNAVHRRAGQSREARSSTSVV